MVDALMRFNAESQLEMPSSHRQHEVKPVELILEVIRNLLNQQLHI